MKKLWAKYKSKMKQDKVGTKSDHMDALLSHKPATHPPVIYLSSDGGFMEDLACKGG